MYILHPGFQRFDDFMYSLVMVSVNLNLFQRVECDGAITHLVRRGLKSTTKYAYLQQYFTCLSLLTIFWRVREKVLRMGIFRKVVWAPWVPEIQHIHGNSLHGLHIVLCGKRSNLSITPACSDFCFFIFAEHYLLFDFPGQVELFFLHENAKKMIMKLIKKLDLRVSLFF